MILNLKLNDKKTDCVIVGSDKKELKCHKVVLSEIEYFDVLFYGKFAKDDQIEFDHDYKVLFDTFYYLYNKKLETHNVNELLNIFKFANEISYHELETFIMSKITIENLSQDFKIDALITKLLDVKKWNEKLILTKIKEICTFKEEFEKYTLLQDNLNKLSYSYDGSLTCSYNSSNAISTDIFASVTSIDSQKENIYICPVSIKHKYCTLSTPNETVYTMTKTYIFKPFLKKYLFAKFNWINNNNIDTLFDKYKTNNGHNIYIFGFKSVKENNIVESCYLAIDHDVPYIDNHKDARLLIKIHMDNIKNKEVERIKKEYYLN